MRARTCVLMSERECEHVSMVGLLFIYAHHATQRYTRKAVNWPASNRIRTKTIRFVVQINISHSRAIGKIIGNTSNIADFFFFADLILPYLAPSYVVCRITFDFLAETRIIPTLVQ